MAITLGPHKIRVNVVSPSTVQTDMMVEALDAMTENGIECVNQFRSVLEQQTPSGQYVTPMSDVVNTILFMASSSAPQITGQCLGVDGGLSVS